MPGHAPPAAPVRTASASVVLAGPISGRPAPWRVLGTSTHAWWCTDGDDVMVVSDAEAVRLPNSVTVAEGTLIGAAGGDVVTVGGGRIVAGDAAWRIGRWWEPAVAPVEVERATAIRLVAEAAGALAVTSAEPFAVALGERNGTGALEAAGGMLGRGRGLTPEGDDRLTGVIAGFRHLAASLGDTAALALLDTIRGPLTAKARSSTTSLSCSLLRLSFSGSVAAPLAALLRALTGRGDPARALDATVAIGASSGRALAIGAITGGAAACGVPT